MPLFDRLVSDVRSSNETSDAAICSVDQRWAVCAPTRFRHAPFTIPLYDETAQPAFPVVRALRGHSGVQVAKDPRGIDVVSAHVPIGELGLGLAVKTDLSTLYAPLRSRLAVLALSIGGLIVVAIYALRSQVRPVVRRLADSERFMRHVTDGLPVRIAYLDQGARYLFVNDAHCKRFGLPRDEILGRTRQELTGTPLSGDAAAALAGVLQGQAQQFEFDEVVDGRTARIHCQLIPDRADDGSVRGFYSTGVDVTERNLAERSQRELAALLENTTDAVVQIDQHGNATFMNPAARRWLNIDLEEDVHARNFAEFTTPETDELFLRTIVPAVAASGIWLGEATIRDGLGRVVPVSHMVIGHADEDVARYSFVMRDISEARLAKEQREREHREEAQRLMQLSQLDPMTGLLNRAGFEALLDDRLRTLDARTSLALLYVDLDRFKPVNDTHGHPVGDELLKQFATRLKSAVRPTDGVARLGGDEFAIVVTNVRDGSSARVVARNIIAAAAAPFQLGELIVHVGASVGIALSSGGNDDCGALVARADAMLYRAKSMGRGQFAES
nr:diguanylate cyclase [Aquabacterium terrae]